MSTTVGASLALRQQIMDHMLHAVETTSAIQTPFPHLQISGLFPEDVYAELLKNLPATSEYEDFAYDTHHSKDNGESNRKRFSLLKDQIDKLPGKSQEVLYAVRSALGSTAFKEAIFNKLSYGLALRYSCKPAAARDLAGYALPELFRETEGYKIKPHPDTRKKVVTMQIALPEDDACQNLGTEFYRRSFSPASWLREPKGFEIVKRMPFLPNTAYAFVVLNTTRLKSWHGRCTLESKSPVRNSLLNIWYEKPENANVELVEENRQQQQRRAA